MTPILFRQYTNNYYFREPPIQPKTEASEGAGVAITGLAADDAAAIGFDLDHLVIGVGEVKEDGLGTEAIAGPAEARENLADGEFGVMGFSIRA